MTSSSEPFIPLTARHGMDSRDITTRSRHVGKHLVNPLWKWCFRLVADDWLDRLGRDPFGRQPVSISGGKGSLSVDGERACLTLQIAATSVSDLRTHLLEHPDELVNLVDILLRFATRSDQEVSDVDDVLNDGGSAWMVARDRGGLVERVDEAELAQARMAMSAGDRTSEQLSSAWDAAWRIKPSAKEAYSGAIEALESMLEPIVTPDDPKPTLGKMIVALGDKSEKWDTRFRGVETVEALTAMLNEVWVTQARHGAGLPNTLDEARDAVSIAVTVVALCRRGFLERFEEFTPEEEAEDQAIAAEWAAMSPEERHADAVPIEEVIASLPAAQG